MNDQKKKWQMPNLGSLGITIALASILIPAVFPKEITVSPFVLFGIVFLTNSVADFLPDDGTKSRAGMFGRLFFLRLVLSLVLAAMLIAIWFFARRL